MYVQLQNFGCEASIKTIRFDGKYECAERLHQFSEIICVFDGEVELTVDGVTECARAGDLAVITPFRTHSFHTPQYCKIWIGVISNNFISHFASGDKLYYSGERAVFTPSTSLFSYVCDHLPSDHSEPFRVSTDSCLYNGIAALSYAVLEEYTRLVPRISLNLNKNALARILLYISEHYREPITLRELGEKLGYTESYISQCISAIPNMNLRKLLNSLRIDKAKQLFAEGKLKMTDVAVESGFSCERTFSRAFVSLCGIAPKRYLQSIGKK